MPPTTAAVPRATRQPHALLLSIFILLATGCAHLEDPGVPTGLTDQVPHPWHEAPARATPASLAASDVDKVFVQCLVLQGNGFNWAATLGWVSSQVAIAAQRAAEYERTHPGRTAAIDFRCMTGSSSGGATTAVVDHLLSNRSITGASSAGDLLLNTTAAYELSKAMIFLALSTDFRGEMGGMLGAYIGARFGWLDRESRGADDARYWRGQSTPKRVLKIFGYWIEAAARYQPDWFDELVGEDAYSIPTFARRASALDDDAREAADERMRWLSHRARRIVDARLKGAGQFAYAPIGDGFCVTTMAAPLNRDALPFDMEQLQLIASCNDETFEILVRSPVLAATMHGTQQTRQRLWLASVGEWRGALNVTVREPGLLTPLSGQLLEAPIGLSAIAAFDGSAFADQAPTEDYLIFGGFAVPKLQAWPATALLSARLADLRALGIAAEGRVALFGRLVDRQDRSNSFAQRTIVDYFSPFPETEDPADAGAVLSTLYAWEDEYCRFAASMENASASDVRVDFFRMDWNLSGTPAAMSRRGRELAALGYDVGKVQLGQQDSALLFALSDDERLVPSPPAAGMACVEGQARR